MSKTTDFDCFSTTFRPISIRKPETFGRKVVHFGRKVVEKWSILVEKSQVSRGKSGKSLFLGSTPTHTTGHHQGTHRPADPPPRVPLGTTRPCHATPRTPPPHHATTGSTVGLQWVYSVFTVGIQCRSVSDMQIGV